MQDEYFIEKRVVPTGIGDIICHAVSEWDGDAVFPIPGIAKIPCRIANMNGWISLSVEPRKDYERPVTAREYALDHIVSFSDAKGVCIGYVFLEDDEPDHVVLQMAFNGDKAILDSVKTEMLDLCGRLFSRGNAFVADVEAALSQVESDCLFYRAAAVRQCAQEMEREAVIMENEAREFAARGKLTL